MEYIKIKTSSPAGDLIAMLAGVKQICKDQNKKALIYQRINMIGVGYQGAEHPYQDDNGQPITMNKQTFEMLKPLVEAQDYVQFYLPYEGQTIDMDFDKCILENYSNQPKGSLGRYLFHVFPQCATDLGNKWISIPKYTFDDAIFYGNKIIINFTLRYRNYLVDYFFLHKYKDKLLFAGLPNEHEAFCKEWSLNIPLLVVKDFIELATILSLCKFFIGNQSMNFWICEALKVPRMLEIFTLIPNVVPEGENAYDYYHNDEVKYYFNKLLNL